MDHPYRLLEEHRDVTWRYFLQLGAAGVAGLGSSSLWAHDAKSDRVLAEAIAQPGVPHSRGKVHWRRAGQPTAVRIDSETTSRSRLGPRYLAA